MAWNLSALTKKKEWDLSALGYEIAKQPVKQPLFPNSPTLSAAPKGTPSGSFPTLNPVEKMKLLYKVQDDLHPELTRTSVRIPFAKEKTFNVPKSDPVGSLIAPIASRIPELVVSIPTAGINFFRKNINTIMAGKPVETEQFKTILGADPRRFGISDEKLIDTGTLLLRELEVQERKNPSKGRDINLVQNAIIAVSKTVIVDVLDALFTPDILKSGVKLAISGTRSVARQLPQSLLFKIAQQDVSPLAIRDVLVGGARQSTAKDFDIANKFIKGLSSSERAELNRLARNYEGLGLNVPVGGKVTPTALGKFSQAKPPVIQPPQKISGLLPSGRPPKFASQAGFLDVEALGEEFSSLIEKARQSRNLDTFKGKLGLSEKALLATRGITNADFYKDANPSEALAQEITVLEETLADHPARPLMQYVSKQTGGLPEVVGGKTRQSLSGDRTVKTGKWGRMGDDIADELGFADLADADKAVESYQKLRADLVEVKSRLKELKAGYTQRPLEDIFANVPTKIDPEVATAGDKVRVPTSRQLLKLEDKERKAVLKAQDEYIKEIQKEIEAQLGAVGRAKDAKGQTELIIAKLKQKGVTDEVINDIVLEDGTKLIDTVKIKREENGVLSAIITKQQLVEIKMSYRGKVPTEKWVKRSAVNDAIKFPLKVAQIYEVPQVYFDRKGLKEAIYDPLREAQRGASQEYTNYINRFKDAGLAKKGGWFTADRLNLSKAEADNIGKYYLSRQGKGYDIKLESLTDKEKEFVKIFDGIIKETEPRFFEVAKKNGLEPTKVENYAPIMTKKDIELIDKGGDMDFITRKHPSFSATKERVEKVPIQLYETDYREVIVRWLSGVTKFNSLGDVAPEIKYLIESEQFKGIVSERDNQIIHDWFRSVMTPDIPKTEAVEAINFVSRLLRKSTAIASLGLNYASVLKQALSQIPMSIIAKAPPKLKSKFAEAFGIKISDLPSITERKGDIAIVDLQGKIGRIFTGALTKFDQINAQKSLNALLDKEYTKFLKGGIEVGAEQKAYILKQAQDKLDLWYGGMTKEQLPPAFRQEVGRFLNMFILPLTSQLNGFFQHILKAKGAGGNAKAIGEVLASVVIIAYLEQVITNLSPQWSDEKQMTNDVLQSMAGNIPIVSQITYSLASDQDIQISAGVSGISNLLGKINDFADGNATLEQLSFSIAETAGLPKQIRRIREGMQIIEDGGIRDKEGKMLAPVTEADEYIRSVLRGKYGSTAAKDWVRNIGEKKENREWFVPQVEFLQNGDYARKAEIYKSFSKEEQEQLRSYLSEGQQKKLDKALSESPKRSLESLFSNRKSLESIFK